jgi:glycosyltransferase involved in cell wall biosynthesis
MGRHVAGESFLHGYLKYGNCDHLAIQVEKKAHARLFDELLNDYQINKDYELHNRYSSAGKFYEGVTFYPGPDLSEWAKNRSFVGHSSWSLCGITHTTASHRAMDAIINMTTSPIQPWDALICTSSSVKRSIEDLLGPQIEYLRNRFKAQQFPLPQFPVIPLGVHGEKFANTNNQDKKASRDAFGITPDSIVILYVGRLSFHAKANPFAMYKAIEQASIDSGRNIVLLECGWFHNSDIENSFSEASNILCPSVQVLKVDGLNSESMSSAWLSADIFCSFADNIQETFGITPVEAMAAGLPVVVSDWNGYKDTVRHGIDGFRISTLSPSSFPNQEIHREHAVGRIDYDAYLMLTSIQVSINHKEASEAFLRLIESESLRRIMGSNGQRRVADTYDWKVVIPQYELLWDQLNERRLLKNKTINSFNMSHSCPSRPDPFAFFANYPTAQLEVFDLLVLKCSSEEFVNQFDCIISMKMFASYSTLLIERAQILKMIELFSDSVQSVDSLATMLRLNKSIVMRTISFLIKVDMVGKVA